MEKSLCLITSSLCHKLKNARKFQAKGRYFIYNSCHRACFYSFTCLQIEDEASEKLWVVCVLFLEFVFFWSCQFMSQPWHYSAFFFNLIRIWDYTDPVLLLLVSAEQALLALATQITAMLLCAPVCLAMNSSVLTWHLSLRPEKEIILAFLLLANIYKSVIYDMSAALKLAQKLGRTKGVE